MLQEAEARSMYKALSRVTLYRVGAYMVEIARTVTVEVYDREERVPFAFLVHDEAGKILARRELGAHGPHAMKSLLACAAALGVVEDDLLRACCGVDKPVTGAQMMLLLRVEDGGCELSPPRRPTLRLVS
jgi:hypothetical protein